MAKIERFEDLRYWQASRKFVNAFYTICRTGELNKYFDTKSQLKRASLSVMNNIAEGFARYHSKEFVRFLDFSQSSAAEVKSMLYVLEDMQYLTLEEITFLHQRVDEVRNQTLALVKYINNRRNTSQNKSYNVASDKKEVYNMRVNLPDQFLTEPWNNQNIKTLTH